jgi:hypothetical protein
MPGIGLPFASWIKPLARMIEAAEAGLTNPETIDTDNNDRTVKIRLYSIFMATP